MLNINSPLSDTFGQIQALKNQNVQPGGVAVLKDNDRYIYYMVTKMNAYNKPTYQNMFMSLTAMKDHMVKFVFVCVFCVTQ